MKWLFNLFEKEFLDIALHRHKPEELFETHKRELLKLAFNEQSKPIDFNKLEQAFIDSNGLKYYTFPNDGDIPTERKGQIARLEQELYSCLSDHELGNFLEGMHLALHNYDEQGNMRPNLGLVGKLVLEMKGRKKLLIHAELMFEIVAAAYIREDENPAVFDDEIQEQKIAQFKKDSKDGLYDFFHSSGISELVPFYDMSEEKWNEYCTLSKSERTAQNNYLENLISTSSKKPVTLEPIS